MMSVNMKEAYAWAKEHDAKLQAGDFGQVVHLVMEDGSTFMFKDAFALQDKSEYNENGEKVGFYYIFTEHYGFHVYAKDEVYAIKLLNEDWHIPTADK